jgi:hypothetical protein
MNMHEHLKCYDESLIGMLWITNLNRCQNILHNNDYHINLLPLLASIYCQYMGKSYCQN